MNAVVIQVQAAERRVISHVFGLLVIDPIARRQGPRIHQESSRHFAQTRLPQRHRKICKPVGVQRWVAPAFQDQVALKPPILQLACGQHLGAEPETRPKPIDGIDRCHGFQRRSGRQQLVRQPRFQHFTALDIADNKADRAAKPRILNKFFADRR